MGTWRSVFEWSFLVVTAMSRPGPELLADGLPELAVALPGAGVRPVCGGQHLLHDGLQLHRGYHPTA